MQLNVNGIDHEITAPLLTPLLHVLREELGVTSPKAGCLQGGCGACTVLIDGEPRRACLLPVAAVNGATVTTLEGIGTPDRLAPIQQAFVHHYGMQCGFCTPGILLAAHAHIERGGGDDQESIAESLAGHVCRCTGYVKILAAVGAAARGESFDLTMTSGTPTTTFVPGATE
jgi:aerobic-type carbon monoxide dehydrogenase small subunit (CoxS/CutS family)